MTGHGRGEEGSLTSRRWEVGRTPAPGSTRAPDRVSLCDGTNKGPRPARTRGKKAAVFHRFLDKVLREQLGQRERGRRDGD